MSELLYTVDVVIYICVTVNIY